MKKQAHQKKKPIVYIILLATIALPALLLMLPLIRWLSRPDTQQQIQEWVRNLGWWGVLVTLLLQMAQVLVSVIPGEPFELMAGVLYGGFGGLTLCVAGCFLATLIAFHLARRFGKPLLHRMFGEETLEKYSFLKNPQRLETVVFLLFLIPGIPKDVLTYIAGGISSMKPLTFTLLATFARIPAIAATTFIGSDLLSGNWVAVVVLFVAVAVFGLVGIHFRNRIIGYAKRRGNEDGKR